MDLKYLIREKKCGNYENAVRTLDRVSDNIWDRSVIGFCDKNITDMAVDFRGDIEFYSDNQNADGTKTVSTGTVNDNSILIKQVINNKDKKNYQMFNVNPNTFEYLFMNFSDQQSLVDAYSKIKARTNDYLGDIGSLKGKLEAYGIDSKNIRDMRYSDSFAKKKQLDDMLDDSFKETSEDKGLDIKLL